MRNMYVYAAVTLLATCSMASQEDVLRPKGKPGDGYGSAPGVNRRPFVLGIEAGLNVNYMSQPYTSMPQVNNSPEEALKSGIGLSPEIGVFADVSLTNSFGLQARMAYDQKYASNRKTGNIDAFPQPDVVAQPVDVVDPFVQGFASTPMETEARFALTMNTLAAAILARIDVLEYGFVTIGPYATFALGDVTRSDRLTRIRPQDAFFNVDYQGNPGQFTQIERKTNLAKNLLPWFGSGQYTTSTYSRTRIGIELGYGYRFYVTPNIFLAPNLRYQLMLTELNSGFTAQDYSQPSSQSTATLQYDKASLNSLALVLQLGFTL